VSSRFCIALPVLLLLFGHGSRAQAQAAPAQSDVAAHGTAEISLGQSVVPLYGPWRFTVGDSPVDPVTHGPLWAEPGFDDSKWEAADLTPKEGLFNPTTGTSGYVPGWTAKGHPGYWGYAWYRIRVHLQERPGEKLALAGPDIVDDAYQFFDNGELVGSFGNFTGSTPVDYYSQPTMFPLSHPAGGNPAFQSHGRQPLNAMADSRRVGPQGQPTRQTPAHFQPGIGERVDISYASVQRKKSASKLRHVVELPIISSHGVSLHESNGLRFGPLKAGNRTSYRSISLVALYDIAAFA
jgi:hypothetical protein